MQSKLTLEIITPKKIALKEEIMSVTAPTVEGIITILPHHVRLFSLLKEGVVVAKKEDEEELFGIGGGYIETDGRRVHLLVSSAYGQDELDEAAVKKAQEQAQKLLAESKTIQERHHALGLLRRSLIEAKLLSLRAKKPHVLR
ncbi:MAG TPA: ATP synthase F1 subunit epsilon [Patescibacteria group bacterium]|nr:ATP synthase F1 subunit epsilon [Patescibacteria group bacterium]